MRSDESRIILISDFIEQKLRKEQELEYYLNELAELQVKIGHLKREVDLTNTIIDMIKAEKVQMIKANHNLIGSDDEQHSDMQQD